MKFVNMKNRGLAYPVHCNTRIVIPAGTKNVKIAFNQSHLVRDVNGNIYPDVEVPEGGKRLNVYAWRGNVYHA